MVDRLHEHHGGGGRELRRQRRQGDRRCSHGGLRSANRARGRPHPSSQGGARDAEPGGRQRRGLLRPVRARRRKHRRGDLRTGGPGGPARADRHGRHGEHRGAPAGGRAGGGSARRRGDTCGQPGRRRVRAAGAGERAKGKATPVQAWLARSAAAAPRERRVSSAPFVGRTRELELLARGLGARLRRTTAAAGHGGGRAGHRQDAARPRAGAGTSQDGGGRVLRGRSLPYGERSAYWVFAQIVREACDIFASDAAATARAKVDDRVDQLLGGRRGGQGRHRPLDHGAPHRGHRRGPGGAVRLGAAFRRGARP